MGIQSIKEATQALALQYEAFDVAAASFRDKTLIIHKKKLLAALSEQFTVNENNAVNLVGALESFLKENWSLIQGTALCYTALPSDDVTQLLISIASFIAEEKKRLGQKTDEVSITPIHLLMPTIALDAARADFPELGADVNIQQILQTHVLGIRR